MSLVKDFLNNIENISLSLKKRKSTLDINFIKERILHFQKTLTELNSERANYNNLIKEKNQPTEEEKLIIQESKSNLRKKEESFRLLFIEIKKLLNSVPNTLDQSVSEEEEEFFCFRPNVEDDIKEEKEFNIDDIFIKTNLHFLCLRGEFVILKRKLENLLLLNAMANKYEPLDLPVISKKEALERSKHLYFFTEMFSCGDGLFLNPTSEVAILDFFSRTNLNEEKKSCCLSSCFRKEGTYGQRDKYTRFFQFNKLELFVFCLEENKFSYLQDMICTGTRLLEALSLPFTVVKNAGFDTSFHSEITYDIYLETSFGRIEVSSCSSIGFFQTKDSKTTINNKLSVSLNGTAFGVERLLLGLLDKYKNPVVIDELLEKVTKNLKEKK